MGTHMENLKWDTHAGKRLRFVFARYIALTIICVPGTFFTLDYVVTSSRKALHVQWYNIITYK